MAPRFKVSSERLRIVYDRIPGSKYTTSFSHGLNLQPIDQVMFIVVTMDAVTC